MDVSIESSPPTNRSNRHYPSNRPPLLPSPLAKLPLGAVRPRGWLARQIDLMVEGLTGRLYEFGPYLQPGNAWLDPEGEPGWEEAPYWFRGFHDMAVISGDKRCLAETQRYIEAAITSQEPDGYFGPRQLKKITGKNGAIVTDIWPHMLMIAPFIHHYEYSHDSRILPFLTRFFEFCRDLPEDRFVPAGAEGNWGWGGADFGSHRPYLQHIRAGDMIPHIYWLYSQTGDRWLLDLATKFFEHNRPPWDEWLDHHAVNFPQRFAYPGIYYSQSGDPIHLAASDYWYEQQMLTWGQMPGGILASDERIRPGCVDPRFAFETCGMIEFARSFYLLGRITGDPEYADRTEEVMLNHYPATHTPDLKAIHYLTAANQPILSAEGRQLHRNNRHHNVSHVGYTPHNRCCGHNSGMGWPWFIQNLWQATSDDGIALFMYGPSSVEAVVGSEDDRIVVDCETDYPFTGEARLTFHNDNPACRFPLYLRVPHWCTEFRVDLNGRRVEIESTPKTYLRIERKWGEGDVIEISMGMAIAIHRWPRNGSASLRRGPLWYSVKIGEKWQTHEDFGRDTYQQIHEDWPNTEVLPNSPWNYGLLLPQQDDNLNERFEISENQQVDRDPWTVDNAPIEISAPAKRIPNWKLQNECFVGELQNSPVKSSEPEETITLIPLGCARLRISCFPVIGDQFYAREWKAREDKVDPATMPVNRFDQGTPHPTGRGRLGFG